MEKRFDKEQHKINRESAKFQRWETTQQKTETAFKDPKIVSIDSLKEKYNEEMVSAIGPNSLLQFTKITSDVLEDEFEKNCNIKWREVDGNHRLYVTQKWTKERSEGQLLIVVTKDHKYNIRLNPYGKYEKHYFLGQNMDTKSLIQQMKTIKWFMANEQVADQSVFKKEEYRQAA